MKELRNSILCIVLVVATLSLSILMVKPACAQSTEPSPPKFTIQIPNNSTIQLVIENQAFTNSSSVNSLVYYLRVKAHSSDTWMEDGDYTLQSNSNITIISISPESEVGAFLYAPFFDNSTSFDFQVQAVTGFYSVTWQPGYMPGMPTQYQPGNGYWEITFNPAESSAWSPTQTVTFPPIVPLSTVPDSSSSTSTSTPTAPEIPILAILPLFLLVISVAAILRHRKTAKLKAMDFSLGWVYHTLFCNLLHAMSFFEVRRYLLIGTCVLKIGQESLT